MGKRCSGSRSRSPVRAAAAGPAFTAGALKTLCEARINDEFEVVGISGTSGGAVCATLGGRQLFPSR